MKSEIGKKFDIAHDEWTKAYKEYSALQVQIRKKVQLPIDARISELRAELKELTGQKREANKRAYMDSKELQDLKQKVQEGDAKVRQLSNEYWAERDRLVA